MSAVETAQKALRKAQDALRSAEQKASDEMAARTARNDERRAAFWSNAGERCQKAHKAVSDARSAVVGLVSIGNISGALDAYAEYVRAAAEFAVIGGLSRDATATYVYQESYTVDGQWKGKPTKEARRREARMPRAAWHRDHGSTPPDDYQTVYPDGVPASFAPTKPDAFDVLLAEGCAALLNTHAQAFRADFLSPLTSELEPED